MTELRELFQKEKKTGGKNMKLIPILLMHDNSELLAHHSHPSFFLFISAKWVRLPHGPLCWPTQVAPWTVEASEERGFYFT